MKILYYDCFCGISGDMNLGALIDLGVDKDYFVQELSKLKLDAEYEIEIKKRYKKGYQRDKGLVPTLTSEVDHEPPPPPPQWSHANLEAIESIIEDSGLSDRVKKLSLKMFRKVAEAEAKVHGKSLY